MPGSWWLVWFGFMFFFLIVPMAYGWRYRGWGPPYPSPVERHLLAHAPIDRARSAHTGSWGALANFMWLMFVGFTVWGVGGLFWQH